ncbi:hypothetical protein DL98DRAFT_579532 [Cadophora sp. DSE1049]|nr:hypothetical protein DL98DRAFT_579532 [Cadophora sp. DSE1049]
MASNNNSYWHSNSMADGGGNRRAVSNGYFSDASIPSNRDFSSTQRTQLPGQPHGTIPAQWSSDNRHVSDPGLMNPYFRSAQQQGQTTGHRQGTFSSHQNSNMRSASGPTRFSQYTEGYQQYFVSHRSTEGQEGYGRAPATMGHEMQKMTAARNQQNAVAVDFGRSSDTSFDSVDIGENSEDHGGANFDYGFGSTVSHDNLPNHILHNYRTSILSGNGLEDTSYQPSPISFRIDNGRTSPQRLVPQSYNGRLNSYAHDNEAGSSNTFRLPYREHIQPQYSSTPYFSTSKPRNYVAPYPSIQQPREQSRGVTQPYNMDSYLISNDQSNIDTVSNMRDGNVQQPLTYSQYPNLPPPNTYSQQTSDSFTSLVTTDNSNRFDGLPSPPAQHRSATPFDTPPYLSPTPARVLSNEEQAQAEIDEYISSDDDNSRPSVSRPRTILLAQLKPHDIISEWQKGSGKFYVFRCSKCSRQKGFENAAAADTFNEKKTDRKNHKKNYKEGYNNKGYNLDGYDKHGFNEQGLDKDGNRRQ